MSRLSVVCRRWRTLSVSLGVFVCLFTGLSVSAQTLPEDAPIVISQPDSTRVLIASPTKRSLQTAGNVVQPGAQVTFYVTNLDLLETEGATAFRADVEDVRHFRYPLEVVSLVQTPERKWVYALTVRLHSQLSDVGDVLLRVTWRGMASNRVRLAVGHEGSKVVDDPGSVPTPMPEAPIIRNSQTQSLVGLPWTGDRARFMEQATFGPKAAVESRLRRISYPTWLAEQMEEKRDASGGLRYSTFPYPNLPPQPTTPNPATCANGTICFRDNYTMYPLQNWFFREALYGEDQQLRRRVSWAMSQVWVVSGRDVIQPSQMLPYIQVLDRNSFGNYRVLMEEMTLNPAMGQYLDMVISTQQSPNENYAREILQLFSIGLFMLNQDGTLQLDGNGNAISTYDQNIVNGFTKVFTGWTYCNNPANCPNWEAGRVNYRDPLVVNAANHDASAKTLLNYPGSSPLLPAGQSADEDLKRALDNIFYHPNVAPFVSKLLIQQMVTSNPTPAYVGRVAAAFNNNGSGIRGDMKAVVRAILLDPEARGNIKTDPDFGKLREPVLYAANVLRPFNPAAQTNAPATCNGLSDGVINGITLNVDQDVFNPPTVFNYYPMDYILPNTNLAAPEFGIFSTGTALKRPNFVHQMVGPGTGGATGITVSAAQNIPCGTRIDVTRLQTLAQADATGEALVDTLNREMMGSAMSAAVRGQILTAVQAVSPTLPLKRAQTAFYLVATAPQFQVQR